MGEVIQLQGDQRKDVQEFLVDKKEGLELDAKTIKVSSPSSQISSMLDVSRLTCFVIGSWVLKCTNHAPDALLQRVERGSFGKRIPIAPCSIRCFQT